MDIPFLVLKTSPQTTAMSPSRKPSRSRAFGSIRMERFEGLSRNCFLMKNATPVKVHLDADATKIAFPFSRLQRTFGNRWPATRSGRREASDERWSNLPWVI